MNRKTSVIRCVNSILKSNCKNLEIIVVDNNSDQDVCSSLKSLDYDNLHIICSSENLGAGGGRNLGAKKAKGRYLLFLDDDNVIDKNMIQNLLVFFDSKAGNDFVMIGPIMLYHSRPDKIWMRYVEINMYTSQAVSKGNKDDYISELRILETGLLPNCFMVRHADFVSIDGFDEKYIVMYEEADLAHRLKNNFGKKIAVVKNAITYHDIDYKSVGLAATCATNNRAYLTARNRIYFMRKNANTFQFFIFTLIFFPLITGTYLVSFMTKGELRKTLYYIRGSISGWYI